MDELIEHVLGDLGPGPAQLGQPLFTLATLWGLWPVARKAWALTRSGSPFAIETLMTVAALGALFLGETAEAAMVLLLFMLATPVFTQFISPLFSQQSRRHEFQADAYAVAQASGADLSSALLKLYEDNASTLTPDPVYVKFYYSHPPATERLARMQTPAHP